MRKYLALLAFSSLCFAGVALAEDDSSIRVINESDWVITQMYLSPVGSAQWGPDQLRDHVVEANGGEYLLHSIECGDYDVKIVAEDGDDCVVSDARLCGRDTYWKITNHSFDQCEKDDDEE